MSLTSSKKYTKLALARNLNTWEELTEYIKSLPYGSIPDRTDFSQVFTYNKGTCSSKHALLKLIAEENGFTGIEIWMCVFKMNKIDTPKIGKILDGYKLEYIPEAHCYLRENGIPKDYTGGGLSYDRKKEKGLILEDFKIKAYDAGLMKAEFQKKYLISWVKNNKFPFSAEKIILIRKECINALSE